MKMYYDIYLRPAGTIFTTFPLTSNILSGWDRLELPDDQMKLAAEGILKTLGDGTALCESEKIDLETGTLAVEGWLWAYLRSTYHKVVCDVLLMDSSNQSFLAAAFQIRLSVTKILESGNSIIIKIKGTHENGLNGTNPGIILGATTGSALIRGIIYDIDAITPLDGASVQIVSGGTTLTDLTDATGEYLFIAGAPLTWTYTVTKSGKTFPAGATLAVTADQEFTKDITALT